MKLFLHPKNLRRGNPALVFVAKRNGCFELGVYHDLIPLGKRKPTYKGEGKEYNQVSCIRISELLFEALKIEALANQKKFK